MNINDLAGTELFARIGLDELEGLLGCIRARCANYKKGDFIIEEGSAVTEFGVMLSGHGRSIKWDASGKLIILTLIGKGDVLGVMLAAMPGYKSPVAVQAAGDSAVMLAPFDRVAARCEKNCPRHEQLLKNYLGAVARKGLELHERLNCLLSHTARDKILAYLLKISREQQSRTFYAPIDRNTMAEYLNIERSALSRELSRMKKDGLLDYHKNCFRLL